MRIEHVLYGHLCLQILRVVLNLHQVALFDAHTMFASQTSTCLDTKLQDFRSESLAQFEVSGLVGVEKYQGVHIPVSGVKDVADL